MAYLAIHANVQPSEYARMDPDDTRALAEGVDRIVRDQIDLQIALAGRRLL